MNDKPKYNPQIHHRRSIRLKGYDYSQAGLYFITICIHNRECLFGEIIGRIQNVGVENFKPLPQPEMKLNDAGKIANECWLEIPKHFPNAVLHEHIVMPNHVHGIIELMGNDVTNAIPHVVGVENFQSLQHDTTNQNKFQKMIPRSIGSIVKGFKIGVTKWFRDIKTEDFPPQRQVWQRNYYEHIIRNEQSYQTISNYIINNPAKWEEDKFYSKKKSTKKH